MQCPNEPAGCHVCEGRCVGTPDWRMVGGNRKLVWRHRGTETTIKAGYCGIGFMMLAQATRHSDSERQRCGCCGCMCVDGWIGCVAFGSYVCIVFQMQ